MPMEWMPLQLFSAHLFNYFANTLSSRKCWENPIFSRKNVKKSLKLKNEGEKRGEADRPWRQDLLNWPSPESQLKQCSSTNAALLFQLALHTFNVSNGQFLPELPTNTAATPNTCPCPPPTIPQRWYSSKTPFLQRNAFRIRDWWNPFVLMSKCQIHRDKLENAIKINVLNSCLMGSDLTTHFYEKS